MSDHDKAMVEAIGADIVERAFRKIEDPGTSERVLNVWVAQFQRAIGRAVLRVIVYVAIGAFGFVALSERVTHAFKELFK